MTQEAVAVLAKVSVGTVHNVETGKHAGVNAVAKIENVLLGIVSGPKNRNGNSAA